MGTDNGQRRRPTKALDRKVLRLWWTTWGVLVTIGAAVASPLRDQSQAAGTVYVIGVVAAIVLAAAIPYLRYRRWRYEIRERDLFLSHGSLFFVLTLIQLVVYTAAGRAARIPGLAPEEAGSLREELSKVAGTQSV